MSDSESRPPNSDSSDSSKKPARRSDRGPSGNLFWYLMIGIVLAAIIFSFSSRNRRGETLPFSEFKTKLENETFTAANVHELKIGLTSVTFQDQPAVLSSDSDKK